ncbi:MAG: T9SS type A sorting domain-containing protein [Calditrichota bacterium]
MKRQILSVWLIVWGLATYASSLPAQPVQRWNNHYECQGSWSENNIMETEDGGFIIAGQTSEQGAGRLDIYIVRLDREGQVVWERTSGGEQNDSGIQLTANKEGYIEFGTTRSFGEGGSDFFAVCFSEDGEEIWTNHYGTDSWDILKGVYTLPDGNYLLFGTASAGNDQEGDVLLGLIDDLGEEIWLHRYEREGDDCPIGVACDQDEFVIAGAGVWPQESWNSYLLRIDSNGEQIGLNYYAEFFSAFPHKMITARDGDVVLFNTALDLDENGEPTGNNFILVQKIGLDGRLRWETIVQEGDYCYCTDAVEARFGGFYLVGGTFNDQSVDDIFAARISPEGQVSWSQSIDGNRSCDNGSAILATPEGGFVIVGTIAIPHPPMPMAMAACQIKHLNGAGRTQWTWTSREYDPGWLNMEWNMLRAADGGYLVSSAYGDMEVYRLGVNPVSADLPDQVNAPFSLILNEPYPNPFNGQVNIPFEVNRPGMLEITILGSDGRQVLSPFNWFAVPGRQTLSWQANDMASGAYWLKIQEHEGAAQERRLVLTR